MLVKVTYLTVLSLHIQLRSNSRQYIGKGVGERNDKRNNSVKLQHLLCLLYCPRTNSGIVSPYMKFL